MTIPGDKQRLKANKMRILLTRGNAGLQKFFPDEAVVSGGGGHESDRSSRSRRSSSVRRISVSGSSSGIGSSSSNGFVVSSKAVLQALGMKVSYIKDIL